MVLVRSEDIRRKTSRAVGLDGTAGFNEPRLEGIIIASIQPVPSQEARRSSSGMIIGQPPLRASHASIAERANMLGDPGLSLSRIAVSAPPSRR
jgi:hypothetical protein